MRAGRSAHGWSPELRVPGGPSTLWALVSGGAEAQVLSRSLHAYRRVVVRRCQDGALAYLTRRRGSHRSRGWMEAGPLAVSAGASPITAPRAGPGKGGCPPGCRDGRYHRPAVAAAASNHHHPPPRSSRASRAERGGASWRRRRSSLPPRRGQGRECGPTRRGAPQWCPRASAGPAPGGQTCGPY